MNILWLSHYVPWPPKGGVLQRGYNLLQQASLKHRVHLVAFNQRALLASNHDVEAARGELSRYCASIDIIQIPSDRSKISRYLTIAGSYFQRDSYNERWLKSSDMCKVLDRVISETQVDLVHVDTVGMMPYVKQLKGVPVVLNHHNAESDMMAQRASLEKNPFARAYFFREASKLQDLERRYGSRCRAHLAVSKIDARRLRCTIGSAPIFVVENGVDIEYFRTNIKRLPRPSLIFVGRLKWYPNSDAMTWFVNDIWPCIREAGLDSTMTIVGRHPPKRVLRVSNRDPRLSVTGYVEDVRPFLAEASVYVCPIRKGGGTRLKVLDALASGLPLVATEFAVEGLGMVNETHYLRAETPIEYVSQIKRLIEDPNLYSSLVESGFQHVEENFSWEAIGRRQQDAYAQAIEATTPMYASG